MRYGKLIAPISVWCNWFAWSPVLATGSTLAAGYILSGLFAPDSVVNTWQVTLLDLGALKTGLTLRINATFILGAVVLLAVKFIQDGGILRSANTTKILGISAMIPLLLIGIVPILTGDIVQTNLFPLAPLARDAVGQVTTGSWNMAGITLFAAGMFLAAWSTYGFETAVCYTGEFKNPKTDTFKAIFYSGLLCVVVYTLVPLHSRAISVSEISCTRPFSTPPARSSRRLNMAACSRPRSTAAPGRRRHGADGPCRPIRRRNRRDHADPRAGALVDDVHGRLLAHALPGVDRRLVAQVSREGECPRRADQRHAHQLGFNLLLLLMSDTVFVIGAANIGYLIFNFLNLNAGWIHRMDRPRQVRPWRAPSWILAAGAVLSFVNLAFMGFGADVYGAGTLKTGLIFAALIIPVFIYRHYIQDKGAFPPQMAQDLEMLDGERLMKRAGLWPYAVLVLGIAVVAITHALAVY